MKTLEEIIYLSDGIALEERENIQKMDKDYSLKLIFATIGGGCLSGVAVLIEDDKGKKVRRSRLTRTMVLRKTSGRNRQSDG